MRSKTIFRHKKTGGLYKIICDDALIEATNTRSVVYKSLLVGQVWVRPHAEFFDGRFEEMGIGK